MHLIHKDLEVLVPRPVVKKRGAVRVEVCDANGNPKQDTGWINNSFTTFGDEKAWDRPQGIDVGDSNAPTTASMVNLVNELTINARNNIGGVTAWNVPSAPDWQLWSEVVRQFDSSDWAPGNESGVIREVGLFQEWNPRGNDLMARVVVPDLPYTQDSIINVYYRLFVDLPTARTAGQIVIDGITYDTLTGLVALDQTEDTFNGVYPSMNSSNTQVNAMTNYGLAAVDESPLWGGETGSGVVDPLSDGTKSVIGSDVVDEPNRKVTWVQRAELNYGNLRPRGVVTANHALNFRRLSGYQFGIGCQFTAVDGPNVGEGIYKDNTQWLNLYWELGYGGVITA
jgi:hypothetical protein